LIHPDKGSVLRKFALLASAFTLLLFSTLSFGQQFDVAAGYGTLLSSKPNPGSLNFQAPAEKGSGMVNVSADFVGFHDRRLGLNLETAFRIHETSYDSYETARPILTDINVLFQPRLKHKIGLEFLGGVGVARNQFTFQNSCNIPGCVNYNSSTHFMEHLGAGVRYYVWRNFFLRPEFHYYHIQNNVEFHSDSVFRASASIGYTFGSH
jgi:opacity protein-like surface antigen